MLRIVLGLTLVWFDTLLIGFRWRGWACDYALDLDDCG